MVPGIFIQVMRAWLSIEPWDDLGVALLKDTFISGLDYGIGKWGLPSGKTNMAIANGHRSR